MYPRCDEENFLTVSNRASPKRDRDFVYIRENVFSVKNAL
jgi:hypothetical protein